MNTKIILGIVITVVLLGGGYLILAKKAEGPSQSNKQVTNQTSAQSFFTGKYEQRTVESEVSGITDVCDTFVVTSGDKAVIEYFKDMIRRGNTVQSLTAEGQLRINLPWNDIPESAKVRLQTGAPVTLELTKKDQELGRGVGPCYSFFGFVGLSD